MARGSAGPPRSPHDHRKGRPRVRDAARRRPRPSARRSAVLSAPRTSRHAGDAARPVRTPAPPSPRPPHRAQHRRRLRTGPLAAHRARTGARTWRDEAVRRDGRDRRRPRHRQHPRHRRPGPRHGTGRAVGRLLRRGNLRPRRTQPPGPAVLEHRRRTPVGVRGGGGRERDPRLLRPERHRRRRLGLRLQRLRASGGPARPPGAAARERRGGGHRPCRAPGPGDLRRQVRGGARPTRRRRTAARGGPPVRLGAPDRTRRRSARARRTVGRGPRVYVQSEPYTEWTVLDLDTLTV